MNEQQRLYWIQARSDWKVFMLLKGQPICHRLHYLQMSTEKLGKAFHWRNASAGKMGHASFVKFVRAMASQSRLAESLGYTNHQGFKEWIKDVSVLAYELERLAPQLAVDGPNPEYPWPRSHPVNSPLEHDFEAWQNIRTSHGRHLLTMLSKVIDHFEEWF